MKVRPRMPTCEQSNCSNRHAIACQQRLWTRVSMYGGKRRTIRRLELSLFAISHRWWIWLSMDVAEGRTAGQYSFESEREREKGKQIWSSSSFFFSSSSRLPPLFTFESNINSARKENRRERERRKNGGKRMTSLTHSFQCQSLTHKSHFSPSFTIRNVVWRRLRPAISIDWCIFSIQIIWTTPVFFSNDKVWWRVWISSTNSITTTIPFSIVTSYEIKPMLYIYFWKTAPQFTPWINMVGYPCTWRRIVDRIGLFSDTCWNSTKGRRTSSLRWFALFHLMIV